MYHDPRNCKKRTGVVTSVQRFDISRFTWARSSTRRETDNARSLVDFLRSKRMLMNALHDAGSRAESHIRCKSTSAAGNKKSDESRVLRIVTVPEFPGG